VGGEKGLRGWKGKPGICLRRKKEDVRNSDMNSITFILKKFMK